ncbi:MAG: acetyl-CoA carboxylase biotin carboxyl carrier protein [Clostridium sp.]|nr:acetyl-CoA carboxylase biotin carboxyl carrier protein [Clostridium sp.]MCI7443648.1 acetyl-CoA carboxylase biotin carboxyl carrier protein [Clostridium sp.]
MDFNGIKELIESVNSSDIAYFEYKTNDGHIKMDKSLTRSLTETPSKEIVKNEVKEEVVTAKTESFSNNESVISQPVSQEKTKVSEDEDLYIVKSPMVGTFYTSPSPDKAPFVSVGDTVKTSSILCIIEAMKLMNEIESEVSGTIKEILVKNGEMVEYGQPLFKIKED